MAIYSAFLMAILLWYSCMAIMLNLRWLMVIACGVFYSDDSVNSCAMVAAVTVQLCNGHPTQSHPCYRSQFCCGLIGIEEVTGWSPTPPTATDTPFWEIAGCGNFGWVAVGDR